MFTTRYSYYINPNTKQFCQTAEGHAPITELPNFYFGDRPTFTLSFPASTFSQGDSIVAVLDNENRFLDTKQATGLNPVMTGIIHEVTAEEASASSVEIQLFDYSRKFADVINGHDNAVTCLFTIYLKSTDAEDNFTFTEIGQTLANAMPTVTSPECMWEDLPITKYMTRDEIMEVYNEFLAGLAAMTTYANMAKSYAVGGTGTRENEDEDNAKYYYEQAQAIYESILPIQENIRNLVIRIDNDTESIERYKNEIVSASANVSTLAAQVQNNAQRVASDRQSVALDMQSVSWMKNAVNDMNNNVNAKADEVNQAAQQVANDKQTVQTLAGQVQNNATQAVNAKNNAQSAATQAQNALTSVQQVQADVNAKHSQISSWYNEIKGWYNYIAEKFPIIQNLATQVQGWWNDVKTWRDETEGFKNNAASSASSASTSASNSAKWAEGTDEQVSALGGTHSAKTWARSVGDVIQTAKNWAEGTDEEVEALGGEHSSKGWSEVSKIVTEGTDEQVAEYGLEHSTKTYAGIAQEAAEDATAYLDVITIPSSTSAYTLQDNRNYEHKPNAVPTYTLPTVTFDNKKHEISLLVDFLHVTSCSFVDAGGVPVTLQSAISPQIGEAYVFRCYWYGKWRVVPLKIRNAATVSSATGVVEVSDAVAGDALALRMVAPRSVVTNQQVKNGNFVNTSYWLTSDITECSFSVSNNTATVSFYKANGRIYTSVQAYKNNHVYAVVADINLLSTETGSTVSIFLYSNTNYVTVSANDILGWQKVFLKTVVAETNTGAQQVQIRCSRHVSDISVQVRNVMLVDLTQYFNGEQALIDSITSWGDLVTYDPRFASYVEYNTGEVAGVQPSVKVTGKNLLDVSQFETNSYINVTNGVIKTIEYVCYSDKSLKSVSNLRAGMTVTFSVDVKLLSGTAAGSIGQISVFRNGVNVGILSSAVSNCIAGTTYHKSNTIVLTEDMIRGSIIFYGNSSATASKKAVEFSNFQIELGSTATTYEPYHDGGTATSPVPLYGVGTAADNFEAVTGKLTHKMASVDLGTLDWTISQSGLFQATAPSNASVGVSYNVPANLLCARYTCIPSSDISGPSGTTPSPDKVMAIGYTSHLLWINDLSYSDAVTFKTAMSGVYLYYELATPTTSQSTPAQISLQAGNNTAMQTDGGRTAELAMIYENLPSAN